MTRLKTALEDNPSLIQTWTIGIEKEGLRVLENGALSQEPHSPLLGSKLCHPSITTDFAENLLEFITPPAHTVSESRQWLHDLHSFTQKRINNELIWPCSMPCQLLNQNEIPIAYYGTSNSGRMKTVYRQGLALRYGKPMQMIAGTHYNLSFPIKLLAIARQHLDFPDNSALYFHVVRNYIRTQALLLLFFGASPALDESLIPSERLTTDIERHLNSTLFYPYATSIRMSNLGYQNQAQTDIKLTFKTLKEYVNTLHRAVSCPHSAYESLGLLDQYGDYQQLTTALLQVENEHYATIRPKQITQRGERPINALMKRGVQYLEIRILDLDPFSPIGIESDTMRFINTLLLHCLIEPSPMMDEAERTHWQQTFQSVAIRGRHPELAIFDPIKQKRIHFHSWVATELAKLEHTAKLLDIAQGTEHHATVIQEKMLLLQKLEHLPSSRVLSSLKEQQQSHQSFGLALAQSHQQTHLKHKISQKRIDELEQHCIHSSLDQQKIEASDTLTFSEYLNSYLTPPIQHTTLSTKENN